MSAVIEFEDEKSQEISEVKNAAYNTFEFLSGNGSQDKCREIYPNAGFYVCWQQKLRTNTKTLEPVYTNTYSGFDTIDSFFSLIDDPMIKKEIGEDNCFYEQLSKELVEIYDIDGLRADDVFTNNDGTPMSDSEILNNFLHCRMDYQRLLEKTYKTIKSISKHDFYIKITPDPKGEKVSFHVIIRNGMKFVDASHAKNFCMAFREYLTANNAKTKFDKSIYTKNRNIRMLGCHKGGQPLRIAQRYQDLSEQNRLANRKLFLASYLIGNEILYPCEIGESNSEHNKPQTFNLTSNVVSEQKEPEDISYMQCDISKLVSLILTKVDSSEHSLCDNEIKNKMTYTDWMKFAFCVINSSDDSNSEKLFKSIYPYYRHVKNLPDVDKCYKDMLSSKGKYTSLNIKRLHYWARENLEYKFTFPEIFAEYNERQTLKQLEKNINPIIVDDKWIIQKLRDGTDDDIACIIHKEFQGCIYITGESNGYVYDNNDALWYPSTFRQIFNRILPYLKRICLISLSNLEKLAKVEYEQQIPLLLIEPPTDSETSDEKKLRVARNKIAKLNNESIRLKNSNIRKANAEKKRLEKEQKDNTPLAAISAVFNYIKSDKSRKSIVNAMTAYFEDESFENKLNSRSLLLAIKDKKTIDLSTGIVRDRIQDDYFTYESPVSFVPDENLEDAHQYFLDLCNGDFSQAEYLTHISLYMISGETFDRSFYFFLGEKGNNGKSTHVNVIQKFLGPMNCVTEKKLLIADSKHPENNNSGADPYKLALRGKRTCVLQETSDSDKLHTANIKSLTGNDKQSARGLHSNKIIEFDVQAKIIIASNYVLQFAVNVLALKNRAKYISFDHVFPTNESFMNDLLSDKTGLLSRIFTVMIQVGKESLQRKKIPVCESVTKFTEENFDEMDSIARFLADECNVSVELFEKSVDAFFAFTHFLINNNMPKVSQPQFTKELAKRNMLKSKKKISRKTENVYMGFCLMRNVISNENPFLKGDKNDDN